MKRADILDALKHVENEEYLFTQADNVRKEHCGDAAQLRGVVHFSNYCCKNDLYCGLANFNTATKRFRMSEDMIVETACAIADAGLRTVVLQSGEDYHYTCAMLCSIIERILSKVDVVITLSLGERPHDELRAFKDAGAARYLMKHETMNPALYAKMRPGQKLEDRLRNIEFLRDVGFQVGVGNIVGLPGQTMEDLCEDIVYFQHLQPDMVNVGPFIPHAQTPLNQEAPGDLNLMLRVFALTRIVTRNTHLAAANTVATLFPEDGQYLAFIHGGANVLMPNCNPFVKSKTDKIEYEFQITTHKRYVSIDDAKDVLQRAGRTMDQGKGDSLKLQGGRL